MGVRESGGGGGIEKERGGGRATERQTGTEARREKRQRDRQTGRDRPTETDRQRQADKDRQRQRELLEFPKIRIAPKPVFVPDYGNHDALKSVRLQLSKRPFFKIVLNGDFLPDSSFTSIALPSPTQSGQFVRVV